STSTILSASPSDCSMSATWARSRFTDRLRSSAPMHSPPTPSPGSIRARLSIPACSTIMAVSWTTSWSTKFRTAPSLSAQTPRIWNEILEAGQEFGIKPCGLGARNTLRLESKMALYGHEIHASITPLEADLAWIVKFDKGEFVGCGALTRQKEHGIRRKLIG